MSYGGSSGGGKISTSADAALSNPADGEALVFNATTQKWVNSSIAKVGGVTVSGTPASGQVLTATASNAATWQTAVSGGGGGSGTARTYGLDPRDYGAKFDGSTNDSAAWQATIDALPANGGTIVCPDGVSIVAGVKIVNHGVAIIGAGGNQYGFAGQGRGTVLKHPDAAPATMPVTHIQVTNGGSGYTSAPTVSFSGGGGSGLTANVYINNGAIDSIRVTATGTGYTSLPTVSFSGGGGSGATAIAYRTSPMFYHPGASTTFAHSFENLTLIGQSGYNYPTQGIVLGLSWFTRIRSVDFYNFTHEALWIMSGAGPMMQDIKAFGAARTGTVNASGQLTTTRPIVGDPVGTIRIGLDCNDAQFMNAEIGADHSGDQTNLPNAALMVEGTAGLYLNIIAEGADVGIRIGNETNRFTQCRADINYGHGWMFTRDVAQRNPARYNYLSNCWGLNNSRYAANTFSNFYEDSVTAGNKLMMCESRGGQHKYGFASVSSLGDPMVVYTSFDYGAQTSAANGTTIKGV